MPDANDWGLTSQGFRRPSYAEILDAFEYQAREKFTRSGKTPDLTVRSPLGMFLRIFAWITHKLFQLLEDIYNSQFVDTAVGTSLFQLGRIIGLSLLPAQRASGNLEVRGSPGVTVPMGLLFGTIAGLQYAAMQNVTISAEGIASVPVRCTEMGAIGNAAENTVTQIVNPITGLDSVTNPEALAGGRGRETDEQYRDRYYRSVDFAGGVNIDAVVAEVLQSVEGILAVKGYENDTDYTDVRGLPPHSFEIVAYAGLDHDIARAIFRRKAAGIQTFGNTMSQVWSDQNGQFFDMHFSRPTAIQVWIDVSNLQVDEDNFPIDGIEQVRAALLAYIGSDISGGLGIGQSVIYNRLPCQINGISGVIDYDMTISIDGISYSRENIPIDEREKAVASADSITVQLAADVEDTNP